jgi:hypothetical protein
MVLMMGLVIAQEDKPPSNEEPVRLKKKKTNPAEPAKAQAETKKDLPDPKDVKNSKAGSPDHSGKDSTAVSPAEEEGEILRRIEKNLKDVEDRLGNLEVSDATVQKQRDILEDLDKLLKKQQDRNSQKNSSKSMSQQKKSSSQKQDSNSEKQKRNQDQANQQKKDKSGLDKQNQADKQGKQNSGKMAQGKSDSGEKEGRQNQPDGKGGSEKVQYDAGPGGEMFKEIWGHLPETLRAELNAYGAPRQFMDRYDAMIRKYYTGVAQKGSKKK